LTCLEISIDDKIFFAGGSSDPDLQESKAMLHAISFDESLELVASTFLEEKGDFGFMGISCMKKLPEIDLLALGVNGSIFLIAWNNGGFNIINKIIGVHSCNI